MYKITFINGLKNIVLDELEKYGGPAVLREGADCLYLEKTPSIKKLLNMRSITNLYLVREGTELNPLYIYRRKALLGDMIEEATKLSRDNHTTFHLSCAGEDSKEIKNIERYISETYKLEKSEEATLELYIGKKESMWEIGIRLTARPLSTRDYRVAHIPGGMNSTVAYAMNMLCEVEHAKSYLNVFSGSGTLLIEAGSMNPNTSLIGFDNNGKHIALAVQNIKKAKMIKRIQLTKADIFDNPELGTFDIITSDLPFGMQIAKDEDLASLYKHFITYCSNHLHPQGTLGVYTSEFELFETIIADSEFKILEEVPLRVPTSVGAYLNTKLFVCSLKK